jgi:hypothetical protein
MQVQATRGVCVGPDQHLAPGQVADVEAGAARFLLSIGAVQAYTPPQPKDDPQPAAQPKPAGKKE